MHTTTSSATASSTTSSDDRATDHTIRYDTWVGRANSRQRPRFVPERVTMPVVEIADFELGADAGADDVSLLASLASLALLALRLLHLF